MGRQGRSTFGSTTSSTSSVAASIRDSILLLGSAGGLAFRDASVPTASTVEYGYGSGAKRRALFNEELMMDDDCYDDHTLHEKKRRLTSEQVHLLEESFEVENKLEPEKKSELAKKLGLQPRQVAVWYQNRRARWKTKQLERDFDRLKALYDNLVADNGSLLADNQRLRSEVVSLTEQLHATATTPATGHHPPLPRPNSQYDDVPPVSEPSAATPAVSLEAKDDFSHQSQLPDDRSFHGGCLYLAPSDEDDFSDDGCGYLPPAFPEDDHGGIERCDTSRYDYMPPVPEDDVGELVGWWIWS